MGDGKFRKNGAGVREKQRERQKERQKEDFSLPELSQESLQKEKAMR